MNSSKYKFDIRFILTLIAAYYLIVYFYIPSTPGNSPGTHPLGWWGWFDQGKYLLSANAFAKFDFSPEKHYYPPLYPALGAIFLMWSDGHLFFLINLSALTWFSYVFIRFADRYISRWGSIGVLFGTIIFNNTIFENLVIPWTSTLGMAFLASGILGLVWLEEIIDGVRNRISGFQVFFIFTCLSLLVPTRPMDAVVGCVIGLGILICYWRASQKTINCVPHASHFSFLVMAGSVIGPFIFFGFNILVFHSLFGNYFEIASSNGFFPADLTEKFISIWLDGFTLYGEPSSGLIDHYPWLLISLAGLIWVFISGDTLLKSIAFSIVILFLLYLPYGDLLPNGLWRFQNIHYFKWTFPFLGLFAVLLIKQTWFAWRQRTGRFLTSTLLLGVPLLFLSLHIILDVVPILIRTSQNQTDISFDLPKKQIDFVDFKGLSGEFIDVYFGSHRLMLDGKELTRVRDYRLLPMSWGVRLLFIRPLVGQYIEFIPDQRLSRQAGSLSAQVGNYSFALGALKPFRQLTHQQKVTDYLLGEIIDFSQQGRVSLYATQGWSEPEAWGSWSINSEAEIKMRLVHPTSQALKLTLVMGGFVSESHPCQEVGIIFNEKKIAKQSLCIGKGGEQPSSYKFVVPSELLQIDGKINILLLTPNSISPKKLGISSDDRLLGVGIKSLSIEAIQN